MERFTGCPEKHNRCKTVHNFSNNTDISKIFSKVYIDSIIIVSKSDTQFARQIYLQQEVSLQRIYDAIFSCLLRKQPCTWKADHKMQFPSVLKPLFLKGHEVEKIAIIIKKIESAC